VGLNIYYRQPIVLFFHLSPPSPDRVGGAKCIIDGQKLLYKLKDLYIITMATTEVRM